MRKLLDIKKGQVFSTRNQEPLAVASGSLWVTFEDDLQDYIFETGEKILNPMGKLVVIETLEDSRLTFSKPEAARHLDFSMPLKNWQEPS